MKTFINVITKINDWVGGLASVLFIPLILVVFLEVVLRYFFNRPTIWAWDVLIQLSATVAVLGGGYNLARREHVMVDIIVSQFPKRVRAVIDLVTGLVFFLSMGVLTWFATNYAVWSVKTGEHFTSVWEPPYYFLRVAVALGCTLLTLQGIVKFIQDIRVVKKETPDEP